MLLITTFLELRVLAERSRTRAGRPHAVSGRPMLVHTCHIAPMPRCAVPLRSCFWNGMVVAWHWRGMACVHQTRPHCVHQMGKTQSKPLVARHGMCELTFIVHYCLMNRLKPSGNYTYHLLYHHGIAFGPRIVSVLFYTRQ
jgi:hypothetical protein